MRSGFEKFQSVVGDLSDPSNPYRSLSLVHLEQIVRAQRAIALGQALGDGILWLIRLPARLRAFWSRPADHRRVLGGI